MGLSNKYEDLTGWDNDNAQKGCQVSYQGQLLEPIPFPPNLHLAICWLDLRSRCSSLCENGSLFKLFFHMTKWYLVQAILRYEKVLLCPRCSSQWESSTIPKLSYQWESGTLHKLFFPMRKWHIAQAVLPNEKVTHCPICSSQWESDTLPKLFFPMRKWHLAQAILPNEIVTPCPSCSSQWESDTLPKLFFPMRKWHLAQTVLPNEVFSFEKMVLCSRCSPLW